MLSHNMPDEDPIQSCRTIVRFIAENNDADEKHSLIRLALLEDLFWKASLIESSAKSAFLAQGMYYAMPSRMREQFTPEKLDVANLINLPSHAKVHKNIGIITIIKPELEAVLMALGRNPKDSADGSHGSFRYWLSQIERADRPALSLVITMIGQPRNVPCAITVHQMLELFTFDLLVLIGIAAGPKGKVSLGDVVAADRVFDYEHVRSELIENKIVEKPRPLFIKIPQNIFTDLVNYNDNHMSDYFNILVKQTNKKRLPYKKVLGKKIYARPSSIQPTFHRGTITAGERLFADGSLSTMRDSSDQRILAGDQEDSGFAQVCDAKNVQWCVFRGIADFGDPRKNDGWHFSASLAAAATIVTFLKHAYHLPSEQWF